MTEQTETAATEANDFDFNSVDWTDEGSRQTALEAYAEQKAAGLKSKKDELLSQNVKLKERAKALEEIELKYNAEREAAERKKLEAKGEYDKLLAREKDKFAAEVAKKDEQVAKMRAALEAKLVDAEAIAAISAAGGSAKLLLPHVKSMTRVVEADNGALVVEVLDKDGLPIDGGFTALIESMKTDEDFLGAFRSTTASGGGATNQGEVVRGVTNPYARETFNMTEQAKLERSNPELAALLKKQAGK